MIRKSISVVKYEGFNSLMRKSYKYTKKRLLKTGSAHNIAYKDVLFINGCTLPHPQRYRVDHQIEQLHFNGYSCDTIYYENLTMESVGYYRAFVFFRCPHTELIGNFINKAKYFNKTVFFDIDDLVIDYKYVKDIRHLKSFSQAEMDAYMDGVNRTRLTLSMCDYAITTTGRLAAELQPYVKEVFINRNVASEKMVELSYTAIENLPSPVNKGRVILGYFSGSITHNEDFDLILQPIVTMMGKYENVYLKIVGFLDVPEPLEKYKDRIIAEKFTKWERLPELIRSVDINLAPLVDTVFNEAKSENKWMEAAFVKVPTIASNVGAFKEVMNHLETGVLCNNEEEWEKHLSELIEKESLRKSLAENAFKAVSQKWMTARSGCQLFQFIHSRLAENIAFVLPSTQISGGVNVVIKHANILRDAGKDVSIISMSEDDDNIINKDGEINVISYHRHSFHGLFDKCVATLWTTISFLNIYPKIGEKLYLVQNFETDFYEVGNYSRVMANLTYNSFNNIKYITISKWCEDWLKEEFGKEVKFAPNGLDLSLFRYKERKFEPGKKVRILVEGNSKDHYKNVDESFKIVNQLDQEHFEIWYLSYNGEPKEWYRVDKFFNKVPYDKVGEVYGSCDILLKSSKLESFSYPPLEMMATGGISIVAPNAGNIEYLKNGGNCLLYEQGNIEDALQKIKAVCQDSELRKKLLKYGLETAKGREWGNLINNILELYGYNHKSLKVYEDLYEKMEIV